ncbi:hypothetical protein, partial [Enterocloster asparagiformis]|uniref:hypothetical protein n=1 Tax=Enterocloster asparagiformis TaxID=333367 RepID=UPI002A805EA3
FLTGFFGQEEEPSQLVCGGQNGAESRVKLACKRFFESISPSDGHPMLLDRLFRSRRGAVSTGMWRHFPHRMDILSKRSWS